MRSKTNFWQIIALIAVIGLLFAACGDSGSGSTTDPGTDDPSGGSSGGGSFYPGTKNPGAGIVDVSEDFPLQTGTMNPAGVTAKATSSGGNVTVTVSGTLTEVGIPAGTVRDNFYVQGGSAFKYYEDFTWLSLQIWHAGETKVSLKQTNPSLNLYTNPAAEGFGVEGNVVYKFSDYVALGQTEPVKSTDDLFYEFLLWDDPTVSKVVTLEKKYKKAGEDTVTTEIITVNWGGEEGIEFPSLVSVYTPPAEKVEAFWGTGITATADTNEAGDEITVTFSGEIEEYGFNDAAKTTQAYPGNATTMIDDAMAGGDSYPWFGSGTGSENDDPQGFSFVLVPGIVIANENFTVKEYNQSLKIYPSWSTMSSQYGWEKADGTPLATLTAADIADPTTVVYKKAADDWESSATDLGVLSLIWNGVPVGQRKITYIVDFDKRPDITIVYDWEDVEIPTP